MIAADERVPQPRQPVGGWVDRRVSDEHDQAYSSDPRPDADDPGEPKKGNDRGTQEDANSVTDFMRSHLMPCDSAQV